MYLTLLYLQVMSFVHKDDVCIIKNNEKKKIGKLNCQ